MVKAVWPEEVDYRPILVDDEDYEWVKNFRLYYRLFHHSLNKRFKKELGIASSLHLDHSNGDEMDYRRVNLRAATTVQNARNRRPYAHSSSKYKGVCKRDKRWQATATIEGKAVSLGMFNSEIDAALAYDTAIKKLYPDCEFVFLNFPNGVPDDAA